MAKKSLQKWLFDTLIVLLVLNEVIIYFYFTCSTKNEALSTAATLNTSSPIATAVNSSSPENKELECALENVRSIARMLKMYPQRSFVHPGGIPKAMCITLGGKNSTLFPRVQLFSRALGIDVEPFEAVNGEKDLTSAKEGNNNRTNFNLPDYIKRTCSGIPQASFIEFKELSNKLFRRLKIRHPTVADLGFVAGKYNDLQSKSPSPYYIYNGNRHCFTGFVWSKLGCWQSHVLAVREAKEANVPTLILEDDVDIDLEFYKRAKKAMEDLPPTWDILRIGSCLDAVKMKRYKNDVYFSDSQICNHGYVVNGAPGAESLLSIIDTKDPLEAFDSVMEANKIMYTKFKSYTLRPYLVTQVEYKSVLKTKLVAGRVKRSVGKALTNLLYMGTCNNCPNYWDLNRNYLISL